MGLQNKGTCNERLFCYTEVQRAEYHYPFYLNISQWLCILSTLRLSSRRKLVAYLNSSLNFPLKNVYFYQGMTPISKVKTLLAFVSICVCNAQRKLKNPYSFTRYLIRRPPDP